MKLISYLALFLASSSALLAADPKAGSLWSPSGTNVTITAGDDIPDPISVIPVGVDSPNFSFVITDSESNVLMYTTKNVIDLDGAPPGTCRVYGISFTGELNKTTGIHVSEVTSDTDNQSLSKNSVRADRLEGSKPQRKPRRWRWWRW